MSSIGDKPSDPQGGAEAGAVPRDGARAGAAASVSDRRPQAAGPRRDAGRPPRQGGQQQGPRPPGHRRYSPEEIEVRRRNLPRPTYPEELPVSGRREEIARAITQNQVVIVAGETGSGKTTQLPKICLELGRGVHGLIGHTQPRRIAARATAARIAHELQTELGGVVGYKIRFTDKVSARSYVKLMTDGILLAETQGDPELRQYDTIIIDEAHERSLNIDFLLGYLCQLLKRRPDLKLIVTSATIDAERFAKHFADRDGRPAPVIEVSGRLYPVDVRYRPVEAGTQKGADPGEADLNEAIVDAVDDLARLGDGDVLVFLPGEREIREAAEALRKHHPPHTEILPLFARLSAAEQERVFKPHNARRIVLATNVAETSLTVPGIRYVVDTGLARVKRYSYRNKVEQLKVEPISQAAARQRSGRCGRVAAGVCIRLYDEQAFDRRPAFTDPELLRSSLAGVILRMKSLHLGDVEDFPFIDPPTPRAIADGYALLHELGAVDEDKFLTDTGRQLARLPLDPRIARMVLAAKQEGSLAEILVIAAALAVQDPRDRPMERAAAADEAQKKFDDEKSDFLSYLRLWKFYEDLIQHKKSNRQLQQTLQQHFLSPNRMREWRDIHSQLKEMVSEFGFKVGELAPEPHKIFAPIHRALLAGLLGNVGMKTEEGNYLGARGIKFWVHPGSGVGRKAGRWIMAAEITETTRLYARNVATIEQEWAERIGAHLVKKSQYDPHWEKKPAHVAAFERATLYGLPLYANRRMHYGPLDPEGSRRIFIRRALVEGDWDTKAPFFTHNQSLRRDIERLEHKSRRPDVLVDDELIYAFYDSLIPAVDPKKPEIAIHNGAAFDAWRREAEAKDAKLLFLKRADLMRHEAAGITTEQFPHHIDMAGRRFALDYHHEPGSARDGVTLTVPLVALNQVNPALCDWLVPGLRREKALGLAKSLPQRTRHRLGPGPEFADAFLAEALDLSVSMSEAIARWARRELQLDIPRDGFQPERLPAHLSMNFRVVDEHGRQLGMGRNLAQLRAELGEAAGERFAKVVSNAEATDESVSALVEAAGESTTEWSFGELAEIMELRHGTQTLMGFPAIVDEGESVRLEVFDAEDAARAAHHEGLRRLFMLQLKEQARFIEKSLPGFTAMAMQYSMLFDKADSAELRTQLLEASFDRACLQEPLPRDKAAFDKRREEGRGRVNLIAQEIARLTGTILSEYQSLQKKIREVQRAYPAQVKDITEQMARLLPRHFIADTPFERLTHFPRYIKAAVLRLDKLRSDPARDARGMSEIIPLQTLYLRALIAANKAGTWDEGLDQFGWLLEELRVQLFAQELRTPVPVSAKRLQKAWEGMRR
jgi:ATP-dependent helicase HrpA